jgi:hypothetical protein
MIALPALATPLLLIWTAYRRTGRRARSERYQGRAIPAIGSCSVGSLARLRKAPTLADRGFSG